MTHITRHSKLPGTWRLVALGFALLSGARLFVSEFKLYLAATMIIGLALIIRAVYTWLSNLKGTLAAAEWAVTDSE
ncbi:MAG: hypothetical protein ACK4TA_01945 [Saprospiraceae bacterium]